MDDNIIEELIKFDLKNRVLSFEEFYAGYPKLYLKYLEYQINKYGSADFSKIKNDYNEYRKSLFFYQLSSQIYNQLLDDFVEVFMSTEIDKNPLSISLLLSEFLIPNGLLSVIEHFYITHSDSLFVRYEKEKYNYDYDSFLEGAYIFSGYGCCRHLASFVSDILTKLGVLNDKLTCITFESGKLELSQIMVPRSTHLIVGYFWNGHYYLEDIMNHCYDLEVLEDDVFVDNNHHLILNFPDTYLFQPNLSWNPYVSYGHLKREQVEDSKQKIRDSLAAGDILRFYEFKDQHLDLYKKLSYLIPIELERREEKEKIKKY